jgi:hypothetical protein
LFARSAVSAVCVVDPACVGLACVWQNHEVINFRETDKLIKERYNFLERGDVVGKISEKNTSLQCRYMNYIRRTKAHMARCTRKVRSMIECLIAGVWKLREIRRNA